MPLNCAFKALTQIRVHAQTGELHLFPSASAQQMNSHFTCCAVTPPVRSQRREHPAAPEVRHRVGQWQGAQGAGWDLSLRWTGMAAAVLTPTLCRVNGGSQSEYF